MALTGRTLNVISLAGIAFAVGMIVDAAIVVLENIFRLREAGHTAAKPLTRGATGLGRNPRVGPDDGVGFRPHPDHAT